VWLIVLRAVWRKSALTWLSYWLNGLTGIVNYYIIFALLFFGAKSIGAGAPHLGNSLDTLFASYVAWMLAMAGCYDLAWNVMDEASTGTLEQLFLSPVGYKWVAFSTEMFNFLSTAVTVAIVVVSLVVTTGQTIHLDVLNVLPPMLAIYLQAVGLGFAIAGLALIQKRVQYPIQVVQFILAAFVLMPSTMFTWAKYLPLSMGKDMLQEVLMEGKSFWHLGSGSIVVVTAITALYMVVGLGCFSLAESAAKRRGLLGHY